MNTYEITFTRENGTTGTDRFTAANEKQARKDFREVYRHGNGTITSVTLVSENVPASKRQEREALDQIRAIVDALGSDSYLATAFSGCFELAEENIENDFALSMKDRAESAKREADELREKLAESEKDYEAARAAAHEIAKEKDAEIAALKAEIAATSALLSRLRSPTSCWQTSPPSRPPMWSASGRPSSGTPARLPRVLPSPGCCMSTASAKKRSTSSTPGRSTTASSTAWSSDRPTTASPTPAATAMLSRICCAGTGSKGDRT